METKIISHGAIKHAEGAPCKICDRMAKSHSKSEAKRVEAVMDTQELNKSGIYDTHTAAPTTEGFDKGKNERMFTEEQVAGMLEEVQKTTTHRIFQALYAMCDQKQNDLAFPALRKFELEALEQSYETDSQSPSGE